jgi:hypothetical protein
MWVCNLWLTVQYFLNVDKNYHWFWILLFVSIFCVISRNGSNTSYSMIRVQQMNDDYDKAAITAVFNYS